MFFEIVLPECKDLEDAFGAEDHDEAHVEVVEGETPHWTLMVMI
jgi:hypothetical protein